MPNVWPASVLAALGRALQRPAAPAASDGDRALESAVRYLAPVAVFLAAFLLYAHSFGAAFAVLDFNHLDAIRSHSATTFFGHIVDPSDGGRTVIGTGNLYRPIYYTIFWFEYQLFGTHALAYYLFNATLQGVNAVLVWLLAWRLTRSSLASFAAAIVWSFHPQYADAVAWVSSTTDLLLVTFGVSAVLLYANALDAHGTRRWVSYGTSVVATLLALGVKETGMAVIPIVAAYQLLIGEPELVRRRQILWRLLPFFVMLGGYIVVRMALVGNLVSEQKSTLLTCDFLRNIHRLSGLAAGPFVGQRVSDSAYGVAQGAAGLALIAAVLFVVLRGSRREWFLAGWYGVALVPVLVLPPEWLVGRYLYLPMIGLAILAGTGIAQAVEAIARLKVTPYVRPVAATALIAGIMLWFGILNAGYQDWLTAKGEDAQTFLASLKATYPSIPETARLIVTGYPSSLSLFPDDGYMLRPAVRLTYKRNVEVITRSQIDSGNVPAPTAADLWYPPRATALPNPSP